MTNSRSASNRHVACAIDVYDYDQHAIDLAATYAKHFGTALDLIYVTTAADFRSSLWPKPVGSATQVIADSRRLGACATTVDGVLVHKHHLSGLPDKAIIEFVREHAPRLLVLGTHGRTGLAKIFGSVATHVMRHVQCPVMVLRQHQNHRTSDKKAVEEVKS